jgi:hypothetical protein
MKAQLETKRHIKKKRLPFWMGYILTPFLILLSYVLSFGPVVRNWDSTPFVSPNEFQFQFYRPLMWAYDSTPLHTPFGKYLHLWDPGMYDENGNEMMVAGH